MRRSSAWLAVLVGGLIAGAFDISYAIIFWSLRGGSATRVLQSVASGLLGAPAFDGGTRTAALGLALHFCIALLWAAGFYAAAKMIPLLTRRAVTCGIAYGFLIFALMNLVVLPLSSFPRKVTFPFLATSTGLLVHMFLIGVPIALAARRALSAKIQMKSAQDIPGVIAFPPLIWLMSAALSVLAHFLFPSRIMPHRAALAVGIVLAVIAPTLAICAMLMMKKAGTNVHPSEPTLTIVRRGPYRFSRNPMYLALCILQAALGFLLNDWSTLAFVIPLALLLHYGVILREEKYLEAKFGDQYLALKRTVRRWI